MSPIDSMHFRPISTFTSMELELQKNKYREKSLAGILEIKKLLFDLYGQGVYVHTIHNYENSPCAHVLPGTITLLTGTSWKRNISLADSECIPVAWEFWRNEVVQHVLESEVV